MKETRINKFLADNGIASRRGADELIEDGRVMINDEVATPGMKVQDGDRVTFDGKPVGKRRVKPRYILLHKPVGYISTTDEKAKDSVMDLVDVKERVFPVGRLDVESSGMIILTNDGEFANELMHPRYEHEKTYEVEVDRQLANKDLDAWQNGIELDDGMTLPAKVKKLTPTTFEIKLREGRNRQIRRMCEALDYDVISLKRTAIGRVVMKNLRQGEWRNMSNKETKALMHG